MSTNSWLQRRVFHWAHQGGARENPSNTMRAFREARAAGAHGLEFDVHATNDGVLVLAHDKSVERMTGPPAANIRDLTLAELQERDPAYNWVPGEVDDPSADPSAYTLRGQGPGDEGLRIPTLESVLREFDGAPVNIELKAPGYEDALGDLLARFNRGDDVIVVAFSGRTIRRFRKVAPTIPTAAPRGFVGLFWLLSRVGIALPNRYGYVALQTPDRMFGVRITDRKLVDAAHRSGIAVHAWTIDEPDRMHAMIDAGADGIMTDRPSVLAEVLAIRGVGWSGA